MPGRITFVLLLAVLAAGCSGSIYRQRPVVGAEPVAITVDARQRVLLSQLDNRRGNNDPIFRRFCAEPSPDVFTVLGVSASGGGSLGLGANSSVNASLQAAFSSSETGATIARTQTLNMLREMMFRTCERYLSGAISADEFPIIAARDQRIMVSILAIEQLTGSITPRAVSLTAGGTAQTGMNATEMVRLLTEARAAVTTAVEDVAAKARKQVEADVPAGNCAVLRQKKATAPASMTTDDTNKLKACDDADAAHTQAVARRDSAQAHYDALVAASRGGLGTSSATTSGSVQFASEVQRSATVDSVARAVSQIVASTFEQDETQLFCIRVLNPQSPGLNDRALKENCLRYLVAQVNAERVRLARRYDLSEADFQINFDNGVREADRTAVRARQLHQCAADPERSARFEAIVTNGPVFDGNEEGFLRAMRASASAAEEYLRRAGTLAENQMAGALESLCIMGGW